MRELGLFREFREVAAETADTALKSLTSSVWLDNSVSQ